MSHLLIDVFAQIKDNKLKINWGWPQVCVGELSVSASEKGLITKALQNVFMNCYYIPNLRGLHNYRTRNSPNRKFEDSETKKKFIELEAAANQKGHRKTVSALADAEP